MRTLNAVYRFAGGEITRSDTGYLRLPAWLSDAHIAYKDHGDWDRALSDQGAEVVESYGVMNESVDVWRCEGDGWLVDWQDTDSVVMSIYIPDALEFARFQTAWLCAMATKIMAADSYITMNNKRVADAEKDEALIH